MEIKSPPAFREEPVIEFDVGFVGVPEVKQITLHEGDTKDEDDRKFVVVTQKPAETVTIYKHAVAWTREAKNILKWPLTLPDAIKEKSGGQE